MSVANYDSSGSSPVPLEPALSPFQREARTNNLTKPTTTYKPSSSANADVDHGKRQHELQLNFKVKITAKPAASSSKPVKLDPAALQDRLIINDEAAELRARYEQASVAELRDELKARGLSPQGKKPVLVERLLNPASGPAPTSPRQRPAPLTIDDIRSTSPNGSPKVRGGLSPSSRYSPYSGSNSPRLQGHLSGLSLSSPLEEDDDSPDGYVEGVAEGEFVLANMRPQGMRPLQSPGAGPISPVEGRPRSQSSEPPQNLKLQHSRRISTESADLIRKTKEKVMGRSSSTSVLPLRKTLTHVSSGEFEGPLGAGSPRSIPRALSSEFHAGQPPHPLHSPPFNKLGAIDEGQYDPRAELHSPNFYQDQARQYQQPHSPVHAHSPAHPHSPAHAHSPVQTHFPGQVPATFQQYVQQRQSAPHLQQQNEIGARPMYQLAHPSMAYTQQPQPQYVGYSTIGDERYVNAAPEVVYHEEDEVDDLDDHGYMLPSMSAGIEPFPSQHQQYVSSQLLPSDLAQFIPSAPRQYVASGSPLSSVHMGLAGVGGVSGREYGGSVDQPQQQQQFAHDGYVTTGDFQLFSHSELPQVQQAYQAYHGDASVGYVQQH